MKVFRIGSSGWEIYGEQSLTHESKTKEEFENDCKEVLTEVFKEVTDALETKESNIYFNAHELMELGVLKLLELGYEKLEFEGDYSVPGDDISFYAGSEESKQEAIEEFGAEIVERFINKCWEIENK